MAQNVDVQYVSFYNAGSSALKVSPVIPLKTLTLPKKKKVKKVILYIDPLALVAVTLALVMTVLLSVGFVQLTNAWNEEAAMASYVDMLQAENAALQAEYDQGIDPQVIEENALALGMIPAEEVSQVHIQIESKAP